MPLAIAGIAVAGSFVVGAIIAQNNSGEIVWPEGYGDPINPWEETNTEVPTPPPSPGKIPDPGSGCKSMYDNLITACDNVCSADSTKAACYLAATAVYAICQSGSTKK